MDKIIFYIVFFLLGIGVGAFYFTNLWKSVSSYKTQKSKLIFSSFLRFPAPIIAVFVAGWFAGLGGIISTIVGFTVFQFVYLAKKGAQLKSEIEEFARQQEKSEGTNKKDD